MKYILLASMFLLSSCVHSQKCEDIENISELETCVTKKLVNLDHQILSIITQYSSILPNPEELNDAQSAWIKYRDLHCINSARIFEEGTQFDLTVQQCMVSLSKARISALKSDYDIALNIIAMKSYIKEISAKRVPLSNINTGDRAFLNSSHAKPLMRGKRNVNTHGYILNNGALLVEQSNQRLKNADHRFYLRVNTTKNGTNFLSSWKVESIYDFEPFSKGYVTDIPLAKGFVLKLPDGLSHYLTKIGVANDFDYISTWQELWK